MRCWSIPFRWVRPPQLLNASPYSPTRSFRLSSSLTVFPFPLLHPVAPLFPLPATPPLSDPPSLLTHPLFSRRPLHTARRRLRPLYRADLFSFTLSAFTPLRAPTPTYELFLSTALMTILSLAIYTHISSRDSTRHLTASVSMVWMVGYRTLVLINRTVPHVTTRRKSQRMAAGERVRMFWLSYARVWVARESVCGNGEQREGEVSEEGKRRGSGLGDPHRRRRIHVRAPNRALAPRCRGASERERKL